MKNSQPLKLRAALCALVAVGASVVSCESSDEPSMAGAGTANETSGAGGSVTAHGGSGGSSGHATSGVAGRIENMGGANGGSEAAGAGGAVQGTAGDGDSGSAAGGEAGAGGAPESPPPPPPPGCEVTGCTVGICSTGACVTPVQVVAEKYNSCAVLSDGTVRCWGDNNFGQLGEDGELQHESPAVEIVGISQATAVAVGARHVCALISTGEVYCWGDDSFGQLGYGKINSLLTTEPVQVKGISTAVEISSSGYYTCARLADGTVSCWGNNSYDQLGDGSHMNQPSPVAVQSLSGVLQISVGSTHACAVTSDTKVRCWGDNGTAQLGDGSTTESAVPKVVGGASPLSNVTQVSAGQYFSCARSSNGTVSCWGNGGDHVLGTTDGKQSPSPISQSVPLGGVLEVTSAEYHSCVRYTNNSVACWGIDDAGELGSMLPIALSTASALSVALPSTVTQLNAGGWHTCAILANQQVWCWGFNNNGQLGASPGAGNGPLQVMW